MNEHAVYFGDPVPRMCSLIDQIYDEQPQNRVLGETPTVWVELIFDSGLTDKALCLATPSVNLVRQHTQDGRCAPVTTADLMRGLQETQVEMPPPTTR